MHEYRHSYYSTHREEARALAAAWRAANPEKVSATHATWRAAHPEKVSARRAAYYAAHPEKACAKTAKRRARKAAATVGDPKDIAAVYAAAKAPRVRCVYCGKWVPKGERHVDHVHPLSKGGEHSGRNLVVACAMCNLKKGARLPQEVGLLL
jgi:5-methylcytosine-specific restriction endonuclease McrA